MRDRSGAEKRARVGWEFVHSLIDDHSRIAYSELHRDEKAATVTAFTERALAFFAQLEIHAQRLQTDNAWTYTHNSALKALLATRGIRHRTIPPRHCDREPRGTRSAGVEPPTPLWTTWERPSLSCAGSHADRPEVESVCGLDGV